VIGCRVGTVGVRYDGKRRWISGNEWRGLKEGEQMQSLKPVESGQDGEAVWVIKNVGVE
jgi:hypothetical protein